MKQILYKGVRYVQAGETLELVVTPAVFYTLLNIAGHSAHDVAGLCVPITDFTDDHAKETIARLLKTDPTHMRKRVLPLVLQIIASNEKYACLTMGKKNPTLLQRCTRAHELVHAKTLDLVETDGADEWLRKTYGAIIKKYGDLLAKSDRMSFGRGYYYVITEFVADLGSINTMMKEVPLVEISKAHFKQRPAVSFLCAEVVAGRLDWAKVLAGITKAAKT